MLPQCPCSDSASLTLVAPTRSRTDVLCQLNDTTLLWVVILKHGFIHNHTHKYIIWDGLSIPMAVHAAIQLTAAAINHFSCTYALNENYATGVTKNEEAKYDCVSPQEVVSQCSHLSSQRQQQLRPL